MGRHRELRELRQGVRLYPSPVGHVANGVFRAEDRDPRTNSTLEIEGQISADGKSTLSARGLTGPSAYTVNNIAPGSPYAYTIDAQFERGRGSGKRNELRPCSFTFVKR